LLASNNTLKISDLSVVYSVGNRSKITALNAVSLEIPMGGYTLGLVGESGSGKTTLGMSTMRLIEPPGMVTNGKIEYLEKDILELNDESLRKYRWEQVAMVFQSAMNSLNPSKTAVNHVAEVLQQHQDISKRDAHNLAIELLGKVGIRADRADGYPHEFSGGMRQRVVISMALALAPKLLIADEPTSALDVVVQKQILTLIKKEVSEKNLSLLFITHEIAILSGLVDNVAVMFAGEVVELGTTSKVLFEPLHPYTQMLLGSMLNFDSSIGIMRRGSDSTSDLTVPTTGCRYARRCKYVFDRCRTERPLLKEAEQGRLVACHKYNA
jgi:peptide/nickel transport system ATP-binding protein